MYSERIQKLQNELGIEVTNFENIGLYSCDLDDQDEEEDNEFAEDNQEIVQDDEQFIDDTRNVLRDDRLF